MRARSWLVSIFVFVLSACSHPTGFRPARTLEAGQLEHGVGLQAATMVVTGGTDALLFDFDEAEGTARSRPFTPTYAIRYGLTDSLEIGGQAGATFARAEATFQLLESHFLDLAIGGDLGLGAAPVRPRSDEERGAPNLYPSLGVPLLVGLRPLPWLSLVGHSGPAYWGWIWAVQTGGGVDFNAIPGISIRPHVSFLFALEDEIGQAGGSGRPHHVFGLDVAFGGRR